MSKRRYGFDEQKIQRFLKEGRGTGHSAAYKPWLTIQDISSLGRSSRIHSFKTRREHHLLSDHEAGLFLMLEWSATVVDIREQFPLEREATRRIARELGVPHPRDPHSRVDLVMTTDFLIDAKIDGGIQVHARAVKPADKLDDGRTVQKLEIERRYWQDHGASWALVTDQDLPKQRIRNLRWLHEMQSFDRMTAPHPDYWQDRCQWFLASLAAVSTDMTIARFIEQLEQSGNFRPDEALTVLRHLVSNKRVAFDLDDPFSVRWPVTRLRSLEAQPRFRGTA